MVIPYYGLTREEYTLAYSRGRRCALCRPEHGKMYDRSPKGRAELTATRAKLMCDLARRHPLAASHAAYLDGYESVCQEVPHE